MSPIELSARRLRRNHLTEVQEQEDLGGTYRESLHAYMNRCWFTPSVVVGHIVGVWLEALKHIGKFRRDVGYLF